MHPQDRATWRAIDRGEQRIDWAAWFGHRDGADYLSDTGRELTIRAADGLSEFFDSRWLPKAVTPGGGPDDGVLGLGGFSPVLQILHRSAPGAWVEAIRWWAAYAYLQQAGIPGLATVRRDARRDVTTARFAHTQVQARLAVLGASRGLAVELEPAKARGGPGDVQVGPLFIEVVTLAEDPKLRAYERFRQRCWEHLLVLEKRGVVWDGDLPGLLPAAEFARWQRDAGEAAERCAAAGVPVEVVASDGRRVTARPGRSSVGMKLTGNVDAGDQGRRLLDKVRGKCGKTSGAGLAWIWVEDLGGLYHPLLGFAALSLAQKVDALGELLVPLLNEHAHVAGVVVSNASRRRLPLPPPETTSRPAGWGLRRGLPLDRVRETLVIPRCLVLPEQTGMLTRLCDTEPSWLPWALTQLGVPGGVEPLLAPTTSEPVTALWTP